MIKLIEELPEFGKNDIAYVKICCNFKAYSGYDKIALFWAQTDEHGKTTALLSRLDNSLTVTENGGDLTEIGEFIRAIGAENIFCDALLAEALSLNPQQLCKIYRAAPPYSTENAAENLMIGIDGLYNRLKNDFVFEEAAFKADISHRLRHDAAVYVTSAFSTVLCLCCEDFCFITGFVTDSSKRGMGLGTTALHRLCCYSKDRPIYVCARENAIPFYEKNNFALVGTAAYCTLEK